MKGRGAMSIMEDKSVLGTMSLLYSASAWTFGRTKTTTVLTTTCFGRSSERSLHEKTTPLRP